MTDEKLKDDFNGDTPHLVRSIEALLKLDAAKALVPHGVGGHARGLLSAAAVRLTEAWNRRSQGWRTDWENAPKDGTQIFARNNRGNYACIIWGDGGWIVMFSDGKPHAFWNGGCGSVPTHFMLIEPPVAESGE